MFDVLTPEEVKPIREIIFNQLRGAIIAGKIKDGERLIEAELAERLKVSRTPIREAIRMLESEGLVESQPRRGVMVRSVNLDDIIEIYRIRQALEVVAFKSAAERISKEELEKAGRFLLQSRLHLEKQDYEAYFADNENFTTLLVEASRMPRAIQLISTYREQLRAYRKITLSSSERQKNVLDEHQNILNALERGEVERVGQLVFQHIDAALNVYKDLEPHDRSGVKA